jgi:enoyl-[acyl-carrier protein] reductase I
MAGRFEGKRGLVLGVANKRSIAWAIAKRLAGEGARMAFTFQGERIEASVRDLAESVASPLVTSCDVREEADCTRVVAEAAAALGGLDFVVHSVAFAWKAASPTRRANASGWRSTSAPTRWWRLPAPPSLTWPSQTARS